MMVLRPARGSSAADSALARARDPATIASGGMLCRGVLGVSGMACCGVLASTTCMSASSDQGNRMADQRVMGASDVCRTGPG